jgi:hypothetical protein
MPLTGNNTTNGSPFASAPAPAPYVIFYHLFQIMLLLLLLSIGLDLMLFKPMFLANCLDLLHVYYMILCMNNLIFIKFVMFYLLLLWIKSLGNLLIFLTICTLVMDLLVYHDNFVDMLVFTCLTTTSMLQWLFMMFTWTKLFRRKTINYKKQYKSYLTQKIAFCIINWWQDHHSPTTYRREKLLEQGHYRHAPWIYRWVLLSHGGRPTTNMVNIVSPVASTSVTPPDYKIFVMENHIWDSSHNAV